jgi:hypothetical protein
MADDDILARFFRSRTADMLVQHVLREVDDGRNLGDILEDAYIQNRTTVLERRALLDRREITQRVGDQAIARIRAQLVEQ